MPLVQDLSYEDCEAWMRDLGIDWTELLRESKLGKSQRYVIKNRWGDNADQMTAVLAALERLEAKQKKKTPTKERLDVLDEWFRVGRLLAQMPEQLLAALDDVRPRAEGVEKKLKARDLNAEGDALLSSAFAGPVKSRK